MQFLSIKIDGTRWKAHVTIFTEKNNNNKSELIRGEKNFLII